MGRLKVAGSRLERATPRVTQPPKIPDPLYRSPEWIKFRAKVRAKRGGRRCSVEGCETPNDRVILNHKVEIRDGGAPFDEANVEDLCFTHHQQWTAAQRRKRARGGGV